MVVDPGIAGEEARPTVLTVDRQVKRLSLVDFPTPVDAITRLRIPNSWSPRRPKDRNDLAAQLRTRCPRYRRGLDGLALVPRTTRRSTGCVQPFANIRATAAPIAKSMRAGASAITG